MKQKKCFTKRCKQKAGAKNKYCPKCKSRIYREQHPMKASYDALKSNAKRRGKVFTISFDYFSKFAYETDYLKNRGRTINCYSVDRIKNELGYIEGNLQVLTVSKNASKGKKVMNYDYQSGMVRIDRTPPGETEFLF